MSRSERQSPPMVFSTVLLSVFALFSLSLTAVAQNENDDWSGEGSLSAALASGNTNTSDIGLSLDLERAAGPFTIGFQARADYGETDKTQTRNYFIFGANIDRSVSEKWSVFGKISYERDEFSGFNSRTFAGGGLGYKLFASDRFTWQLQGGAGWKSDKVKATTVQGGGAGIFVPSKTENAYSLTAGSNAHYRFSEFVTLSNDTDYIYADLSSQISNILALDTALGGTLRARTSFEVRHDTNPPFGFKKTDTILRFSLIYGFGGG